MKDRQSRRDARDACQAFRRVAMMSCRDPGETCGLRGKILKIINFAQIASLR
jgi:hypothetical protein